MGVKHKGWPSMDSVPGVIHCPYIPTNIFGDDGPIYRLLKTCVDVSTTWYTIKVGREIIKDWIISHDGWRYASNPANGDDHFGSICDLREDMYIMFVLRWGE